MTEWEYRPECHHTLPDEYGECVACGEVVPVDYEPPLPVHFTIDVTEQLQEPTSNESVT